MTVAILPAAGASRRMGRPKLLLPFGASTVVGSLVAALRDGGPCPGSKIVLVHAPDDRELAAWAMDEGLRPAVNPDPSRGMLSSLWAGLASLGGATHFAGRKETLLVSPADLPALRGETVRKVVREMERDGSDLVLPAFRGRRGHPLGISPRLIPEIEDLDPAIGLRQLVERYQGRLRQIEVEDSGAVRDVDTPHQYQDLLSSLNPGDESTPP